jgi:hypothetical protein
LSQQTLSQTSGAKRKRRAPPAKEKVKRSGISYVDACSDPNLFGPWFSGPSWDTWRVIDKAIFGLPMSAKEKTVFTELTGRTEAPTEPASEVWLAFGRRAGKDVKAASYAVYAATIGAEVYGHRKRLTRGERGVVQLFALDRKQAGVAFDYCKAFFEQPLLAKLVKRITTDTIELTNKLVIEVTTNNQGSLRGRTVICAILDEVAHWRSENTVTPDTRVYDAITPGMANVPNALLIGISSPYSRHGLLYKKVSDQWAKPGRTLVARAPTRRMNPTIARDGEYLREQFDKDAVWAASEFGAEWRVDIEAFLSLDAIKNCIDIGTRERPHERKHEYVAFCDPSGGSNDSMTLAIAHTEGKTQILDLIRERMPPFSPEAVAEEFAKTIRSYRCTKVWGDRYGAQWVQEQFRKHGVNYEPSEKVKSEI